MKTMDEMVDDWLNHESEESERRTAYLKRRLEMIRNGNHQSKGNEPFTPNDVMQAYWNSDGRFIWAMIIIGPVAFITGLIGGIILRTKHPIRFASRSALVSSFLAAMYAGLHGDRALDGINGSNTGIKPTDRSQDGQATIKEGTSDGTNDWFTTAITASSSENA